MQALQHNDEVVGMAERQRTQEYALHEGEDCGSSINP